MFKFLLKLFGTKKPVEQTGIIFEKRVTDYLGGTLPYKVLVPNGDWEPFEPTPEDQYKFYFDTMSCTTFSITNIIEAWFRYQLAMGLVPKRTLTFLQNNSFFDDKGNVNISDRYTAIISGTTYKGNSHVRVLDAVRLGGFIPESMFKFENVNTFAEYHDVSKITKEMYDLAPQILKHIKISYEWCFYTDNDLTADQISDIQASLKQSPLAIAIPRPAYHAVMLSNFELRNYRIFNSYPPYGTPQRLSKPINYGLRVVIEFIGNEFEVLKRGSKGQAVKDLQKLLKAELPQVSVDGDFGPQTERALKWVQGALNLRVDGIYGANTKQGLEGKLWLPITNFKEPNDKISGVSHIAVRLLQRVRNTLKFSMLVSSGLRTKTHNKEVGGASDSSHLTGLAMDIDVSPAKGEMIIDELKKLGVGRFGRYSDHIHFDIDLLKSDSIWDG